MSEPLTAAGAALVKEVHGTTMALTVFPARIRAIEAEAAARAVDEALSGWAELVKWATEANNALAYTVTNVTPAPHWCRRVDGTHDATCAGFLHIRANLAAALVAHLRGPRPEGEG